MVICSDPSVPSSALRDPVSPPRGWPQSFSQPLLKRFCTKILKGKRARLVDGMPSVDTEGTKQIVGFAIAECASRTGVYVATPLTWLENASTGQWMIEDQKGLQHVLVESALSPAAAAQAVTTVAAATGTGAANSSGDVPTPPPQTQMVVLPQATPPPLQVPPTPPSAEKQPTSARVRTHRGPPSNIGFLWRSHDEMRIVARDEKEEKKGHTQRTGKRNFPGGKGQVRVILHEGGTFEFEARKWGAAHDGLREGLEEGGLRREPELFAPLEYGDGEAAALHMTGTWKEVTIQGGKKTSSQDFCLQVLSVEELRAGDDEPPITKKEIEYACGRYLEKRVVFMRLDDGLLDKKDRPLPVPQRELSKMPASAAKPGGSHYQSQKMSDLEAANRNRT